jgi:hypothetical protein
LFTSSRLNARGRTGCMIWLRNVGIEPTAFST